MCIIDSDKGVRLVYGSDSPVASYNPILGISSALMREGLGEDDVLYGQERLTATECLKIMSMGAAHSRFYEDEKGKVLPGMLADLTILDRDIRLSEPSTVTNSEVVGTIVDGRIVYLKD